MPDLGTKYECAECGAKFYDLGKPEPLCPKCGTDARLHQETKRPASEPRSRYVAPAPAPVEEVDEEVADDIGEEDEEILEVEPTEAEEEEDDDED
jgi:uncharacterized protein (TIGR02300 family)